MRVEINVELPKLPRRRRWRIGLALVLALALAVPGVALASHQFGDVPNSNPFHGDIAAIADAGVTAGCGGGDYCPKEPVTREQMAAFMNRLGALGPGKTPVVNADRVDGIDASQFLPSGSPPGGTTIRGSYALSGYGSTYAFDSISFGAMLPEAPSVHFLTVGASATATCPGSPSNPQAQPGHLCVYETSAVGVTLQSVRNLSAGGVGSARWGAGVIGYRTTDGTFYSFGSWAVTVPLGIVSGSPNAPR